MRENFNDLGNGRLGLLYNTNIDAVRGVQHRRRHSSCLSPFHHERSGSHHHWRGSGLEITNSENSGDKFNLYVEIGKLSKYLYTCFYADKHIVLIELAASIGRQ